MLIDNHKMTKVIQNTDSVVTILRWLHKKWPSRKYVMDYFCILMLHIYGHDVTFINILLTMLNTMLYYIKHNKVISTRYTRKPYPLLDARSRRGNDGAVNAFRPLLIIR